ncbi:hypothetical protein [Paenibacillus cucumis (ex Kampfer et al. 2016)]|uniref:Uncharacterized protein n=1 Tax=Paenibacillus cucumis (ex Kampfer et al. 2016) TaxID=1776858 RepID=A0ABS7KRH7_9BACL|nr:hypothetical protein [Paenibacillus cucumis (ex Kampfer et al. 2016)]MBY0206777.1 hypothetical protein [Paenibacillus cucumis (ex Kampfer et al. 2016)]
MKTKLVAIIVLCSITLGGVTPITPVVPIEKQPPVIITTNGHGMGS